MAPYEKMHEEDKKRVERQTAELKKQGYYTLADGSKSTDPENAKLLAKKKKKTAANDESDTEQVLKPKRATTAWVYYNSEKTAELKAQGKGKQAMVANSETWGAASEEEKAPYVKMAADDEQRYQKQIADFEKKGWFTMGDGSKSTDAKNAHLIKKKSKKPKADGDTKSA